MSQRLFVGIDVSSKENVVCCLSDHEQAKPLSRFTVPNNRPGIMTFHERILSLAKKHEVQQIRFGLEHTGCYSTHVAMYLQRHLDFASIPTQVSVFNPSL